MRRLLPLSALLMFGCADTEVRSLEIGEVEVTKAREDDATAPTIPVMVPIEGPVAGMTVRLPERDVGGESFGDGGDEGDGSPPDESVNGGDGGEEPEQGDFGDPNDPGLPEESDGSDQPPPGYVRPVAVVFVVDQNADMADVRHLINEPVVMGARALTESADEGWFGLVGHVDRRAHLLYRMERAEPENHRRIIGAAAQVTTCSTLEDMHGWIDTGYDNPVLTAPPCWADENGHDPATALAFAQHMLEQAPSHAEKAIVWVGARPPAPIVSGERRPQGYGDQVETWKRTDREVGPEILAAHTQFVTQEVQSTGVRILHVPVADPADLDWVSMVGTELATGPTITERAASVHDFVGELRAAAAEAPR